jgi:hypothetical protein
VHDKTPQSAEKAALRPDWTPNPPPTAAQQTRIAEQMRAAVEVERQKPPPYRTKSGRILTEDDFEALADEAEQGYDIEHLLPAREDQPAGEPTTEERRAAEVEWLSKKAEKLGMVLRPQPADTDSESVPISSKWTHALSAQCGCGQKVSVTLSSDDRQLQPPALLHLRHECRAGARGVTLHPESSDLSTMSSWVRKHHD